MWAESDPLEGLDPLDDFLLADIKAALVSPDLPDEPSPTEIAALHATVAVHFPPSDVPAVAVLRSRSRRGRSRRVRSVWLVGSAAAVLLLSTSAAAAAGGVPMPRPLRAVAYAVGLPVDSPALADTHQHLRALDEGIDTGDRQEVRRRVRKLQEALAQVPDDERHQAQQEVAPALAAAAFLLDEDAPPENRTGPGPAESTATDSTSRAATAPSAGSNPTTQTTHPEGSAPASTNSPPTSSTHVDQASSKSDEPTVADPEASDTVDAPRDTGEAQSDIVEVDDDPSETIDSPATADSDSPSSSSPDPFPPPEPPHNNAE